MASASMSASLRQVERLFREGSLVAMTDEALLARFVDHADEDAFAALVARHGPMVLKTCLDVLRDPADAEDAFQSTFLTLVRRAGSIRGRECLGGWLHRVARRCAFRVNAEALQRRRREQRAVSTITAASDAPPMISMEREELRQAIGAEIDRLPESYRRPVVLCLIEGLRQPEAAGRLNVSEGVVRGRLARARALLRDRLARRGLIPPSGAGEPSGRKGDPVVPAAWVGALLEAARRMPVRRPIPGVLSAAWLRVTAAFLSAVCVLAAAGAANDPPPAKKPPRPASPPPPPTAAPVLLAGAPQPEVKQQDDSEQTVILRGNVVGPDGNAVAGARLYLVSDAWASPVEQGKTGADGSYHLVLPAKTFRKNFDGGMASPRVQISFVAAADGLGPDWRNIEAGQRVGVQAMLPENPLDLRPSVPRNDQPPLSYPAMMPEYQLDFHLSADRPITGRIVDANGKPMAGANIAVETIRAVTDGRWEPIFKKIKSFDVSPLYSSFSHPNNWSSPINGSAWQFIPPAIADADGRFRLTGVGRDRAVSLRVTGPGVQPQSVIVLTRDDVTEITGAMREEFARLRRRNASAVEKFRGTNDPGPSLFDPSPTIEVDTTRTFAGVVRNARTGEPIPGAFLWTIGEKSRALSLQQVNSDASGHYRGLRGDGDSDVWIYAHFYDASRYLNAAHRVTNASALRELVTKFDIIPGIVVTGRVLEAGTGQPIVSAPRDECGTPGPLMAGRVTYLPLATNKALRETPTGMYFQGPHEQSAYSPNVLIDGDGRFRIAVPPGPGVLLITAQPGLPMIASWGVPWKESDGYHRLFPYAPLTGRTKDDGGPPGAADSLPGFLGPIPIAGHHAYRIINPPADAKTLDLTVEIPRPPSRMLKFVDPEGRPVHDVTVHGLIASNSEVLLTRSLTQALALDPAQPRELIALSGDGRYYAKTTISAQDPQPRTIRLVPTCTLTGRLVDGATSRPLAGYLITLIDPTWEQRFPVFNKIAPTDANGRFEIRGLIPGYPGSVVIREPIDPANAQAFHPASLKNFVLKQGETREVGEVRITKKAR